MATSTSGLTTFFGSRAKYRTLTPQTIIVMATGLAFAADMLAVYFTLDGAQQNYGALTLMLTGLFALAPLVGWLVMSSLVYLIARSVKASIRYGTLLRVTGWASVPMIGAGLSLATGRYLALSAVDSCTETAFSCDPTTYATITEQVRAIFSYTTEATASPVFLAAFALSMAFAVATAVLWVLATEEVSTLTRQGALVAAGIPAVVFVSGLAYVVLL